MRPILIAGLLSLVCVQGSSEVRPELRASLKACMPLDQGWENPPLLARTRVWWWWLNGNIDKETITRDLEAMKANGIGGANIIDAGGDDQRGNLRIPHGPDFGSPAWRELFRHAVTEAGRLGLELGFNIQSGWNLGGPGVTVEESSKRATFSLATAEGGKQIELALAKPKTHLDYYQDVAVVAWPLGGMPSELAEHLKKSYFQYPGGFTAAESWHLLDPGTEGKAACQPDEVIDLTDKMDAGGMLRWEAPVGNWEIMRFGYTSSGAHVSTHSENGGGLAIDYLDRATFDSYWDKVVAPILDDVKPQLGRSLRYLHTDSWELGPVNWTRLMPQEFQRLRGYDIKPMLPVIAGRIVGDHQISNRFLNDFRRTLADLMAENKYQRFGERARAAGLGIHPESGGPHAGPMDALRNLGLSDIPMGEFWSTSPQHRVQDFQRFFVKQTTSAANTYGLRISLAEAFTNIGRHWQHDPRSLKPCFDRAACEGHNLAMWHTFPASAKEHGLPGAAYFAGEHFNPNITWWKQGRSFVEYMNRCHFLLQQGVAAHDVLHFYGENIPSFVRLKRDDPAKCMPGYDYDVIDLRALTERTSVDEKGQIVLPEGTSYRMLSITPHDAIGLPALRHIAKLVANGATLVGMRPQKRFGLTGETNDDNAFQTLCDQLWGDGDVGQKSHGKGRVIWGKTTREVLQDDGVPEDVSWSGGDKDTLIDFYHRRTDDAHVYFVVNRNNRPENIELCFRVSGLHPELWDPVTGTRRDATDFRMENGVTLLPYPMQGEESLFVIFRKPPTKATGTPNVTPLVAVADVSGPWKVSFDPKWGGPAEIEFADLTDWTRHSDPGIRHYSGGAVYEKTITAPQTEGPLWLDLGMVESLCEVTVNGKNLGVFWSAPFRADLTGIIRPGENQIRVHVVNLWCNRIIGDASLPPEKRLTRTNITNLTAKTPLEASGLLGPVRLMVPGDGKVAK